VTWKKRSELKPGDTFVMYTSALRDPDDVLVVVSEKLEVGFWRGGVWNVGDVAPSWRVCVLS
jgi:hypothetical protein